MEEERRINWLGLFIKIIIIFIFTLIIIWLVSKIIGNNKPSQTFTNNINNMEKVAIEYFKTIDLPLEKGKSIKVTLEDLIEKELIVSVNSNSDNLCDTDDSYSKITREKNKYVVTTVLKCGKEKDTIKKSFPLEDCKNCNQSNTNKENNTNEENDNNNTNNSNNTNKENETNGVTYYEYVKETTTYTKWMSGSLTGDNIENKYEYYEIADKTYYSLGVIPKNEKTITYTLKLNDVPNKDYYFTTINKTEYYNSSEESNYLETKDISIYDGKKVGIPTKNIGKYALGSSNFDYKLTPYYKEGSFYVKVTIVIKNTDNIETYYDSKLKKEAYIIPLKFNVKFASNKITDTKPSGEHETIAYYRYVTVNKETIWSTEKSVEGYKKTGKTQIK